MAAWEKTSAALHYARTLTSTSFKRDVTYSSPPHSRALFQTLAITGQPSEKDVRPQLATAALSQTFGAREDNLCRRRVECCRCPAGRCEGNTPCSLRAGAVVGERSVAKEKERDSMLATAARAAFRCALSAGTAECEVYLTAGGDSVPGERDPRE